MQVPIVNFTGMQWVDNEGKLTAVAASFLAQLVMQLQQNLSNEGFVIPSQDQANVNALIGTQAGSLVFNTTTQTLQILIGGVWQDLQAFLNLPAGSVLTTEG